jgi:hypothetical protein
MTVAYLTRRATFSAAHRYWREEWTAERNREVFGSCANPHGHGHTYVLEATVEGEVDGETGFSVDLARLDRVTGRGRDRAVGPPAHQPRGAGVRPGRAGPHHGEPAGVGLAPRRSRAAFGRAIASASPAGGRIAVRGLLRGRPGGWRMTDPGSSSESGPVPVRDLLKQTGDSPGRSGAMPAGAAADDREPMRAGALEPERRLPNERSVWARRPGWLVLRVKGCTGPAGLARRGWQPCISSGRRSRSGRYGRRWCRCPSSRRLDGAELSALYERATPIEMER